MFHRLLVIINGVLCNGLRRKNNYCWYTLILFKPLLPISRNQDSTFASSTSKFNIEKHNHLPSWSEISCLAWNSRKDCSRDHYFDPSKCKYCSRDNVFSACSPRSRWCSTCPSPWKVLSLNVFLTVRTWCENALKMRSALYSSSTFKIFEH
jgi:hypothetical protein